MMTNWSRTSSTPSRSKTAEGISTGLLAIGGSILVLPIHGLLTGRRTKN
jgi:hypothetical protein